MVVVRLSQTISMNAFIHSNTAVLLIGFGGPTSMAEVRPFLASVLQGVKVPEERVEEVYRHYEAFNGVSPYNEVTFRQQKALAAELESRGAKLPVLVGFRHAAPRFQDVFSELKKKNVRKVIGFVLSPFRTYASFEKYRENLLEARRESGGKGIEIVYTSPFHSHALFIDAQARRVERAISTIPRSEWPRSYFIFSAHSVPVPMSDKSGYSSQFFASASLVAGRFGFSAWMAAYQSRSGGPREPWLAPDVKDVIRAIDKSQFKNAVLIPVGFLCDHVEVLYDLDKEARETAELKGLRYCRASTVNDEPEFIRMMADQVLEAVE